jgi:hypothetical protein
MGMLELFVLLPILSNSLLVLEESSSRSGSLVRCKHNNRKILTPLLFLEAFPKILVEL